MEGKQLRRFQSSRLSKYPWLTYSRSENGGYCAYSLAFASSVRTGKNLGALMQSPLVESKKALETLASHGKRSVIRKCVYQNMVSFLELCLGGVAVLLLSLEYGGFTSIKATVETCSR